MASRLRHLFYTVVKQFSKETESRYMKIRYRVEMMLFVYYFLRTGLLSLELRYGYREKVECCSFNCSPTLL